MNRAIAILLILLSACAVTPPPPRPINFETEAWTRMIRAVPPPRDCGVDQDSAQGADILMGACRYTKFVIEGPKRLAVVEAQRDAAIDTATAALALADEERRLRLSTSWWDRNSAWVFFGLGVLSTTAAVWATGQLVVR